MGNPIFYSRGGNIQTKPKSIENFNTQNEHPLRAFLLCEDHVNNLREENTVATRRIYRINRNRESEARDRLDLERLMRRIRSSSRVENPFFHAFNRWSVQRFNNGSDALERRRYRHNRLENLLLVSQGESSNFYFPFDSVFSNNEQDMDLDIDLDISGQM
jgi:hypothetical protein